MMQALSDVFGASPGALAESAVLAVAFAWLGYRMSVRHRAVRGVTPWRVPSFAWAIICLVFLFIGLAIEILAELTTRPALPSPAPPREPATPPPSPYRFGFPGTAAIPGATPVEGREDEAGGLPPAVPGQPLPPKSDVSGRPPLFGWYPDPRARHEFRYFDGRYWSDLVTDAGSVSSDPVAD